MSEPTSAATEVALTPFIRVCSIRLHEHYHSSFTYLTRYTTWTRAMSVFINEIHNFAHPMYFCFNLCYEKSFIMCCGII